MKKAIMVINAGSSSIKFSVFEFDTLHSLLSGQVAGIGTLQPNLVFKNNNGDKIHTQVFEPNINNTEFLKIILNFIKEKFSEIEIISFGHRIVHGGTHFSAPVLVDANVISTLKSIISLSPLHMPHNVLPIEILADFYPYIPQVACFDTAFHRTNNKLAQTYSLPKPICDELGILRYGFHGLSYEHQVSRLKELDFDAYSGNVVSAHLGSGASLAAIKGGVGFSTTMGFTPLEGIPMATRAGSIDIGIVLYLIEQGYDLKSLQKLFFNQSGIKGLTTTINEEGNSDFYEVKLKADAGDEVSHFAQEYFCYYTARTIASLMVDMGGLDAITFTGGVGENDAFIRNNIISRLSFLGISLDSEKNNIRGKEGLISSDNSKVKVFVIHAQEELVIAKHTKSFIV